MGCPQFSNWWSSFHLIVCIWSYFPLAYVTAYNHLDMLPAYVTCIFNHLDLLTAYVNFRTACTNRYSAAARSSEQRATTKRVQPPRACLQSVVIPSKERAPIGSALQLGHQSSVRQSVVLGHRNSVHQSVFIWSSKVNPSKPLNFKGEFFPQRLQRCTWPLLRYMGKKIQ